MVTLGGVERLTCGIPDDEGILRRQVVAEERLLVGRLRRRRDDDAADLFGLRRLGRHRRVGRAERVVREVRTPIRAPDEVELDGCVVCRRHRARCRAKPDHCHWSASGSIVYHIPNAPRAVCKGGQCDGVRDESTEL